MTAHQQGLKAWEQAGLDVSSDPRTVRHARQQAAVLLPLLVGVLFVYYQRVEILGERTEHRWHAWSQWGTVIALLAIGWTLARAIARAAGPTFARRMDPSTAGTLGFIVRLLTLEDEIIVTLAGVTSEHDIMGD